MHSFTHKHTHNNIYIQNHIKNIFQTFLNEKKGSSYVRCWNSGNVIFMLLQQRKKEVKKENYKIICNRFSNVYIICESKTSYLVKDFFFTFFSRLEMITILCTKIVHFDSSFLFKIFAYCEMMVKLYNLVKLRRKTIYYCTAPQLLLYQRKSGCFDEKKKSTKKPFLCLLSKINNIKIYDTKERSKKKQNK